MQINKRIGQFLKLRRTRRDFQTAELRVNVCRRNNRLNNRARFVRRAVSRKRFGRRRRENRKLKFRRVRQTSRNRADLETRDSRAFGRDGKTNFGAVIRRNRHAPTVSVRQIRVRRANRYVNCQRLIGLILQHDGQLRRIAEIHKTRRTWANHQFLPRRDRRFGFAEFF